MPKSLTPTHPTSAPANSGDHHRVNQQRNQPMSPDERQAFKRSQAISAKTTRNVMRQLRKK